MSLRAVIFDMDGVVVDSELHWKAVEPKFLEGLALGWTADGYHSLIGRSIQDIHALLVRDHGLRLTWPEFLAAYDGIADEIYDRKAALLPGFSALLDALSESGTPAALASSSPRRWVDKVVGRFALESRFAAVVSADDLKGEGKPSPAIYLETARRLGVEPAACVAVEDSANGILAAKRAGMACVGLRNGFNAHHDLSGADLVVEGFGALLLRDLRGLAPQESSA